MANMELIEAKTLTTTTPNFTFSAIPATYTDLYIVVSARSNTSSTQDGLWISQINGSGSNLTNIWVRGSGSSAISNPSALYGILTGQINAATSTANTFSNLSIYIPNYASANYKSISVDSVQEHNATEAYMGFTAGLWSNSAAITSITLDPQVGDLVQYSTAYLYGISNVTSTTKATGGIVSSDGVYNYHMFPFSGTFTPTAAITADYLVIAGGGGGASQHSAGGGGGGLRTSLGATPLSLTAQAYSITVGAGGAGSQFGTNPITTNGINGSNSVFSTITASGGGGGGRYQNVNGNAGGSGGGGGPDGATGGAGNAGSYSPVEGFAGGNGAAHNTGGGGGGGGGGAGGVGANAVAGGSGGGGNGGNGVQNNIDGNNYYWAGGGGGATIQTGTAGAGEGGLGGGGGGGAAYGGILGTGGGSAINSGANGQSSANNVNANGGSGGANSGGGGGGGGSYESPAGSGGSGIVIIRYAI